MKKKEHYRGCGSGTSCTARAVPAHIFASTVAGTKTIGRDLAHSHTAERDGRLRFGGGCEPSSCGVWLSRWGALVERREFSMAGTLVKHPKGDLLIDTGFGRNIAEQFRTLPFMVRAITFYSLWQPAADQLSDIGYDSKSLRSDPFALGPRQRPTRFSRRSCVGDAAGTRVHPEKRGHGFLLTFYRHTV